MIRASVIVLAIAASAPAAAQVAPVPAAQATTPAASITPAQAQRALEVLSDDARRTAFIATLETIAKAAPVAGTPAAATATSPVAATGKLPIPLAPGSLGAQLLVTGSERLSALSADMVATVRALTDFPLLANWVAHFGNDPAAMAALVDAAWRLLAVMALALAAEWLTVWLLRRPGRALEAHAPFALPNADAYATAQAEPAVEEAATVAPEKVRRRASPLLLLRRLPFVLGDLLLNLLPVMVLGAVGYVLLGTNLGAQSTSRLVILAVLNAYVLLRTLMAVTRVMASPDSPRLRLLQISDSGAAYLVRWVRRIAGVAIFGYAATEVALLFGLYQLSHDALLKLIMLIVHVMLVIVVLQKREAVAVRLRAPKGRTGLFARLRNRAARSWHVVAMFYIVALWLVWAFEVPNGFARLIHFFLATVLVVTAARLAAIALLGAVDRTLRIRPELSARFPGLEARARSYHPVVRGAVFALMSTVTSVVLLEVWGIDALAWFSFGALGRRLVGALGIVVLTIVLAVLLWEAANAGLQRHLDHLDRDAQLAKSARLRTLLPMLRTTLLVLICLVAGLEMLSEVGVNIGPLLAGAGVVGIAVGFGSQKLVQDIINGLFLLLENAMQVGDVVTLGGLSGTVENLSIRTIRLRALDGAVHIVPFSAVTTVTNMTRDYSYALLDISIGLNEDPDHVAEVMREVAAAMRADPEWEAALRDDAEVMGLEKFIDLAYVMRVRIKTLPAKRWAVARELNRRIKQRFDSLGIESPITSHAVLGTIPGPPAPAVPPIAAESHA